MRSLDNHIPLQWSLKCQNAAFYKKNPMTFLILNILNREIINTKISLKISDFEDESGQGYRYALRNLVFCECHWISICFLVIKMNTMQFKMIANDEAMIFQNLLYWVLSKLEYEKNAFEKRKKKNIIVVHVEITLN